MEELFLTSLLIVALMLRLPVIQKSHYLCTVRTSAFGFAVPLFLKLLTICANRIIFGIFHGSFAHIFAIYISCLGMLEILPKNVKNWWTIPLKDDPPSGISLRNLDRLESHLAMEEITWSSWISEFVNRRRMGRDENRTLEMKNRLPHHPLNRPNLLVQTK